MIQRTRNAVNALSEMISEAKLSAIHFANTAIFGRIGLRLVNAEYYDELLRLRYEHYFLQHGIEQLEDELAELQPAEEVQG